MELTILGTGGALAPSGRAQSGLLVEDAGHALLVDCGSGVLLRLDQADVDIAQLDTVLLTHCHLDHMSDLLPLITARWLSGQTETTIYGPRNTEATVRQVLAHYDYVDEHVSLTIVEVQGGESFPVNGFEVETLRTEHGVPSRAYKIDGRLAISGDTMPIADMSAFIQNCDLLVHECSFPDGHDPGHHTTPADLGPLLSGSALQRVVLTHFYPAVVGHEAEMTASVRSFYHGEVKLAEDLERWSI
jgi:ribonuclease BN (tRNA processing enzyme)